MVMVVVAGPGVVGLGKHVGMVMRIHVLSYTGENILHRFFLERRRWSGLDLLREDRRGDLERRDFLPDVGNGSFLPNVCNKSKEE